MLYNEKRSERINEYITCLKSNITNKAISKIHVLYDSSADDKTNELFDCLLQYPNITIDLIHGRATYQYCFELANRLYPNQNIILSNADIFFNETLSALNSFNLSNRFLALTRWTVNRDNSLTLLHGTQPISTSQDAWIFQTPIKQFKADIPLGVPGCDNAIAFQAQKASLKVIDPCLTIQCCHLHRSDIHNYALDKVVPPPYLPLPITTLPNTQ